MFRWLLGLFDDDTLRAACERRGIDRYQDPVDRLEELPDERGTVYAWQVENTERQRSWLSTLAEYQDRYGEFDALHVVITDREELHRLNAEELEAYL